MDKSNIKVFTEKSLFAVNNVSPDRTDRQNNIKVQYLIFQGRKKQPIQRKWYEIIIIKG